MMNSTGTAIKGLTERDAQLKALNNRTIIAKANSMGEYDLAKILGTSGSNSSTTSSTNSTSNSSSNSSTAVEMNITTQIATMNATMLANAGAIKKEVARIDELQHDVANSTFDVWINASMEAQTTSMFKIMNKKFAAVIKEA